MGGQNARISKHSAAGRVGGEEAREEGEGEAGEEGEWKERRVHIKTRTHQQESGGKNTRTNIFQFPGGGLGNQNPARTIAHSPPGVKETLNYWLREKSSIIYHQSPLVNHELSIIVLSISMSHSY